MINTVHGLLLISQENSIGDKKEKVTMQKEIF